MKTLEGYSYESLPAAPAVRELLLLAGWGLVEIESLSRAEETADLEDVDFFATRRLAFQIWTAKVAGIIADLVDDETRPFLEE